MDDCGTKVSTFFTKQINVCTVSVQIKTKLTSLQKILGDKNNTKNGYIILAEVFGQWYMLQEKAAALRAYYT